MRSLSFSAWLPLTLLGCAHTPRQIAPEPEPVEDARLESADSEVYAQLAHDRRHQGISFLEEMLGVSSSDTAWCEEQVP